MMLQFGASPTDDTRSVNYDHNMFIITATDVMIISNATIGSVTYDRNGTANFKNCKQSFEYQQLLLLRDIWWS